METRVAWTSIALLAAAQLADVLTTAYANVHGGVEVVPVSARVLSWGGIPLLAAVKFASVAMGGAALLLAARWRRRRTQRSRSAWLFSVVAIEVATVLVALTAVQNAVLIESM